MRAAARDICADTGKLREKSEVQLRTVEGVCLREGVCVWWDSDRLVNRENEAKHRIHSAD